MYIYVVQRYKGMIPRMDSTQPLREFKRLKRTTYFRKGGVPHGRGEVGDREREGEGGWEAERGRWEAREGVVGREKGRGR